MRPHTQSYMSCSVFTGLSLLTFCDLSFLTETYLNSLVFTFSNFASFCRGLAIQGCALISSTVILLAGSATRILPTKSFASAETMPQVSTSKSYLQDFIYSKSLKLSSSQNGGVPERRMNATTPILQISHSLPYGFYSRTSGATQPGVPQVVLASDSSSSILANPKSAIFSDIIPKSFDCKRRFSGLISLCKIPWEWQ